MYIKAVIELVHELSLGKDESLARECRACTSQQYIQNYLVFGLNYMMINQYNI